MKKYTLREISVKDLKLFNFPVDIKHYNVKKEKTKKGRYFENDRFFRNRFWNKFK